VSKFDINEAAELASKVMGKMGYQSAAPRMATKIKTTRKVEGSLKPPQRLRLTEGAAPATTPSRQRVTPQARLDEIYSSRASQGSGLPSMPWPDVDTGPVRMERTNRESVRIAQENVRLRQQLKVAEIKAKNTVQAVPPQPIVESSPSRRIIVKGVKA
jgi:hypothetical protein